MCPSSSVKGLGGRALDVALGGEEGPSAVARTPFPECTPEGKVQCPWYLPEVHRYSLVFRHQSPESHSKRYMATMTSIEPGTSEHLHLQAGETSEAKTVKSERPLPLELGNAYSGLNERVTDVTP